jgi:hypothetical protein
VISVREDTDTDASWKQTELSYKKAKADYEKLYAKWVPANNKCLAVVKNTIEPAIMGSIPDCATITEYLEKLKNQYTGSSKIYATQLIKQLVSERYNGGGIREHIHRMVNQNNKLKSLDLAFKEDHIIHLVFASLPKEFDTFVVNYNTQPHTWGCRKDHHDVCPGGGEDKVRQQRISQLCEQEKECQLQRQFFFFLL